MEGLLPKPCPPCRPKSAHSGDSSGLISAEVSGSNAIAIKGRCWGVAKNDDLYCIYMNMRVCYVYIYIFIYVFIYLFIYLFI